MEIAELILIGLILYGVGGVFAMLLFVAGEDLNTFNVTEQLIAWPAILIGLIIKTVIKVFKYVKE